MVPWYLTVWHGPKVGTGRDCHSQHQYGAVFIQWSPSGQTSHLAAGSTRARVPRGLGGSRQASDLVSEVTS